MTLKELGFISTAEAAALAAERGYPVQVKTVKQWCARGRFETQRLGLASDKGGRWLIKRDDFEAFLATRTDPPKGGRPRKKGAADVL